MTGSVKTRHNSTFFIFHFITFLLSTYPNVCAGKVSASYSNSFWSYCTALQSSSNRKIDLYSKYRENKQQALPKTDVTYEWSEIWTQILHQCVCHELRNELLGKLFLLLLLLSFITTKKVKIHEEILIMNNHFDVTRTTAITYNSFGALQSNKDFRAPLVRANKMISRF